MEWQEVVQAISTVGFPIIVAMYSLIRLETTVKENTHMLTKLYEKMDNNE